MSVRKTVAAKVATKPISKLAPEPTKRTHAKKVAKPPPVKSAPDALEDVFEPGDQPILEALSARLEGTTARQKNPHPKGSLAFGTWVIGRLGGWTAYYGKPGPKVISRGLYDFQRIKYGAELRL